MARDCLTPIRILHRICTRNIEQSVTPDAWLCAKITQMQAGASRPSQCAAIATAQPAGHGKLSAAAPPLHKANR